jgi:hypothetical protein
VALQNKKSTCKTRVGTAVRICLTLCVAHQGWSTHRLTRFLAFRRHPETSKMMVWVISVSALPVQLYSQLACVVWCMTAAERLELSLFRWMLNVNGGMMAGTTVCWIDGV